MRPDDIPEYLEWLKSLTPEEIQEGNEQDSKQAEEDWKEFQTLFSIGTCYLCRKPLKSFSKNNPCLHWLLRPKGFNKKHFPLLYEKFTYFRIEAYIRWVASIDSHFKGINDLKEEHPGGKLFDFTAKYKHITWSVSCSEADFKGHTTTAYGNIPHYHFKMNLERKPFITYSDFHVPFHKEDLFNIELITNHSDVVKQGFSHGVGMESLLGSEEGLDAVIEHSVPTDNLDEAEFNITTMVTANEGETISGSDIVKAIDEAKATGKTVASVFRSKLQNTSIVSTVSLGEAVPEPNQRKGGRRKKKDIS